MPIYKQVNGELVELSPQEETARQAEWDAFEAERGVEEAKLKLIELDHHLRRAEEELIDAGNLQVSQFLLDIKAEKDNLTGLKVNF